MENFEAVDYIFITIVLFSALFGFARGFVSEVFTILNLFLAGAATYYIFPHAYEFFFKHINNETVVIVLCTFFVFAFFWLIIGYFSRKLVKSIDSIGSNFADKLLGTGLGLLRGIIIVILIYMSIVISFHAYQDDTKMPEWMLNAKSHNFVKMQTEYFLKFMPDGFQKAYREGTDEPFGMFVDSLSEKAPVTGFEKKLAATGLTMDNVKTLRQLTRELPVSFENPYTFPELAELDKMELKEYVTKMVKTFEDQVKLGKINTDVTQSDLDSLMEKVDNIVPGDGYDDKGIY